MASAAPLLAPALTRAEAGALAGWPNRPLRLIVPFPPGGTTDLLARLLSDGLAARLGQPVVAENRGGAGGAVGAEIAARLEPDGYNLFFGTIGSAAIIPHLQARLNYRPSDLVPVTLFADLPNVISVAKNARWKTLAEMLEEAKRHPGKLSFASSGIGSSLHLSGELLKAMAGVDILHVPFRGGGDVANEIMAGRVDFGINNLPSAIGLIRGDAMRGLAVTSAEHSPVLPEIPTIAETPDWPLAGYEATAWFGLQVPIRTADGVIARLNAETNAVLADATTRARMEQAGARPRGGSPAEFAEYIRLENAKWAEVIRRSGARAE
jgi:tripartite-type tricarboxylate transporter receptor subunit TctC